MVVEGIFPMVSTLNQSSKRILITLHTEMSFGGGRHILVVSTLNQSSKRILITLHTEMSFGGGRHISDGFDTQSEFETYSDHSPY